MVFTRSQFSAADLYVAALAGGEASRLTKDNQTIWGMVWLNNREILFSSSDRATATLWRIAADGKSERQAYQRSTQDTNIWRMEISVPAGGEPRTTTPAAPAIASTRMDTSPQFSPDGSKMVFARRGRQRHLGCELGRRLIQAADEGALR